jgi:hypothetical protein
MHLVVILSCLVSLTDSTQEITMWWIRMIIYERYSSKV